MANKKKDKPTDTPSEADIDTPPDIDGEDDVEAPVTDPEIERVASALKQPPGSTMEEEDPEPAPAPVPTRKAKKKLAAGVTHVVTEVCGELRYDGVRYYAGDGLTLSPTEAASLGAAVEPIER